MRRLRVARRRRRAAAGPTGFCRARPRAFGPGARARADDGRGSGGRADAVPHGGAAAVAGGVHDAPDGSAAPLPAPHAGAVPDGALAPPRHGARADARHVAAADCAGGAPWGPAPAEPAAAALPRAGGGAERAAGRRGGAGRGGGGGDVRLGAPPRHRGSPTTGRPVWYRRVARCLGAHRRGQPLTYSRSGDNAIVATATHPLCFTCRRAPSEPPPAPRPARPQGSADLEWPRLLLGLAFAPVLCGPPARFEAVPSASARALSPPGDRQCEWARPAGHAHVYMPQWPRLDYPSHPLLLCAVCPAPPQRCVGWVWCGRCRVSAS
mmetsp:Transcript_13127/g.43047  ORF Transcript_13127/g.43047 Transcript_13127/m.43047 type:complete len:323 (+) Transcript_13127:2014-2982(+)